MHRSSLTVVMVLAACCSPTMAQVWDEYDPVRQPVRGGSIVDGVQAHVADDYTVVESAVVSRKAQAEPVHWLTDYRQARKMADDKSRPVLLFVTSDGCHYCEMMNRDVFGDPRIVDSLNKSFVAAKLKLDPDSVLAEKLKITLYPTTIILDVDGTVLDYARGYRQTAELQNRMQTAIDDRQTRIARK